MEYLVGIDLGTSSVRSMLLCPATGETKVHGLGYDVDVPRIGWAEQDPCHWYEQTAKTLRHILQGVNPGEVKGVSFSGQMHGLVCLGQQNELLRPAIIWPDQRSAAGIRHIYDTLGRDFVAENTQNTISTGFLVASLYWLKQNEPETYKKIKTVLLPKDYIKYRLTGRLVTDYSDAAGSLAFDNIQLRWATPLLQALQLEPALFPQCLPSEQIIGKVTAFAAEETGLAAGTPVGNGGGDQYMQAVGNGIIEEGVFACNIGTGGQISTSTALPVVDPMHRVSTFAHVLPGKWNVMGAMLNAGAALKWLDKQVIAVGDYALLDAEAEKLPPGSEGLLFLPYLTGERTPLMDPDARGVFFGLTPKHNRYHMAKAVMEGVVFALKDCMDIITQDMGIACQKVIAAGGGAQSGPWLQMQADILGYPIHRSLVAEQACLGAAIAAGVGVGSFDDFVSASRRFVRLDDAVYTPIDQNQRRYAEYRHIFGQLYQNNKALFGELTRLGN